MRLLFYSSNANEETARLVRVLEREVQSENLEIYRTVQGLAWRLSELGTDVDVVTLLASDEHDLLNLLSIRDLLMDQRIILVLQETSDANIANAHSLRPRYLSFAEGSFTDIALVLGKMLEQIQRNGQSETQAVTWGAS